VVILESTVYPGATLDMLSFLGIKKKNLGSKIFVVYSPERENPGSKSFNYRLTPKIVSGYSKNCTKIGDMIYALFVKKRVLMKSISEAEATKLLENLYRSVNIGLVNEFKIICDKMNLNVFNIIEAASTKNFGFKKFLPGPGLGGHCIPIDPYYLYWASAKSGYLPKFIKTSGEINNNMPQWVVDKIIQTFKNKKITYKNKKMLMIGVAYKKNVDDDRETPAYEIIKKLKKENIEIDYYDPFIPKLKSGRKYHYIKKSIKFNSKNIRNYVASIIVTDHEKIDYKMLLMSSKLIFDSRGVYKDIENNDKIIKC